MRFADYSCWPRRALVLSLSAFDPSSDVSDSSFLDRNFIPGPYFAGRMKSIAEGNRARDRQPRLIGLGDTV
jgi:hypothetical protein